MWGDHLDIARACAAIAEHDLPKGIAAMGASMHVLQRDLIRLVLIEEAGESFDLEVGVAEEVDFQAVPHS